MSNPPRHAERSAEGAPQGANRSAKSKHLVFRATIIRGAGRGKTLGTPTFNLTLEEIPRSLEEGIFAVRAGFEEQELSPAVMHYGPRPVFGDTKSCEVHLLERSAVSPSTPLRTGSQRSDSLSVEVVERLRDVQDFETPEELQKQITQDINDAKTILGTVGA